MYNIDSRGLKSNIGMLLLPRTEKGELEERIAYYFPLVLDIIVDIMNSETRHTEDAINEELIKYREDVDLQFFCEIIHNEVREIKKQFIMAGFDRRLKFRLMTRVLPRTTIKYYGIGMDLELTFEHFQSEAAAGDTDEADVIDHPSVEDLERYFDREVR